MIVRLAIVACGVACSSPPKPPLEPDDPGIPVLAFDLVESTPVETTLDTDLPNADQVWLELIGSAKTSLDFAEFYASNSPGSKLEPIVRALEDAMKRGVKVRFLADKGFVKTYPDTLERLGKAGATVRPIEFGTGALHAKYFVVDGRESYFGSQNFDYRSLEHNLELGVHVRDRTVSEGLEAIFAMDWARAGGESVAPRNLVASRLVASPKDQLPPGVTWDLPELIGLVDRAKTRVRLQALSYLAGDWTELEDALVRAAGRGVSIELMVSDWAKAPKTIGGLQKLAQTPNIAIRLVTIPAWSGGFIPYARVIHAKLLVADGEYGWVGTGNFERGYFYADRNVGVRMDHLFANQLDKFFEKTWSSRYATPIDPAATYVAPKTH